MEFLLLMAAVIIIYVVFIVKMSKRERDIAWKEHEEDMHDKFSGASYDDTVDDDDDYFDPDEYFENMHPNLRMMYRTLKAIGCELKLGERNTLWATYRETRYLMEFNGMYVRIWEPRWAVTNIIDPDFPAIRDAVNAANFSFGPTIVISSPDDNGKIAFHSRRDILLHPDFYEKKKFVSEVFDSFKQIKIEFRNCYEKIRNMYEAKAYYSNN